MNNPEKHQDYTEKLIVLSERIRRLKSFFSTTFAKNFSLGAKDLENIQAEIDRLDNSVQRTGHFLTRRKFLQLAVASATGGTFFSILESGYFTDVENQIIKLEIVLDKLLSRNREQEYEIVTPNDTRWQLAHITPFLKPSQRTHNLYHEYEKIYLLPATNYIFQQVSDELTSGNRNRHIPEVISHPNIYKYIFTYIETLVADVSKKIHPDILLLQENSIALCNQLVPILVTAIEHFALEWVISATKRSIVPATLTLEKFTDIFDLLTQEIIELSFAKHIKEPLDQFASAHRTILPYTVAPYIDLRLISQAESVIQMVLVNNAHYLLESEHDYTEPGRQKNVFYDERRVIGLARGSVETEFFGSQSDLKLLMDWIPFGENELPPNDLLYRILTFSRQINSNPEVTFVAFKFIISALKKNNAEMKITECWQIFTYLFDLSADVFAAFKSTYSLKLATDEQPAFTAPNHADFFVYICNTIHLGGFNNQDLLSSLLQPEVQDDPLGPTYQTPATDSQRSGQISAQEELFLLFFTSYVNNVAFFDFGTPSLGANILYLGEAYFPQERDSVATPADVIRLSEVTMLLIAMGFLKPTIPDDDTTSVSLVPANREIATSDFLLEIFDYFDKDCFKVAAILQEVKNYLYAQQLPEDISLEETLREICIIIVSSRLPVSIFEHNTWEKVADTVLFYKRKLSYNEWRIFIDTLLTETHNFEYTTAYISSSNIRPTWYFVFSSIQQNLQTEDISQKSAFALYEDIQESFRDQVAALCSEYSLAEQSKCIVLVESLLAACHANPTISKMIPVSSYSSFIEDAVSVARDVVSTDSHAEMINQLLGRHLVTTFKINSPKIFTLDDDTVKIDRDVVSQLLVDISVSIDQQREALPVITMSDPTSQQYVHHLQLAITSIDGVHRPELAESFFAFNNETTQLTVSLLQMYAQLARDHSSLFLSEAEFVYLLQGSALQTVPQNFTLNKDLFRSCLTQSTELIRKNPSALLLLRLLYLNGFTEMLLHPAITFEDIEYFAESITAFFGSESSLEVSKAFGSLAVDDILVWNGFVYDERFLKVITAMTRDKKGVLGVNEVMDFYNYLYLFQQKHTAQNAQQVNELLDELRASYVRDTRLPAVFANEDSIYTTNPQVRLAAEAVLEPTKRTQIIEQLCRDNNIPVEKTIEGVGSIIPVRSGQLFDMRNKTFVPGQTFISIGGPTQFDNSLPIQYPYMRLPIMYTDNAGNTSYQKQETAIIELNQENLGLTVENVFVTIVDLETNQSSQYCVVFSNPTVFDEDLQHILLANVEKSSHAQVSFSTSLASLHFISVQAHGLVYLDLTHRLMVDNSIAYHYADPLVPEEALKFLDRKRSQLSLTTEVQKAVSPFFKLETALVTLMRSSTAQTGIIIPV